MNDIKSIRFPPPVANEMVRAMLEERKTVTRRVVKNADSRWNFDGLELNPAMAKVRKDGTEYPVDMPGLWAIFEDTDGPIEYPMVKAPYRPGDILYVRETWAVWSRTMGTQPALYYKADGNAPDGIKWRPSIRMPREAARIFLRVTDVRVERLQEITPEQAMAEGVIDPDPVRRPYIQYEKVGQIEWYARNKAFPKVWNSTIKPADRALYGWEANPWVWVIGFERISKVDMLKEGAVE